MGRELNARGHQVQLLANESFASLASVNGLAFRSIVSPDQTDQLLNNPNNWHPTKSALHGARWMNRMLEPIYDVCREEIHCKKTIIVNYPGVFAGKLLNEIHGNPLISLVPMPWMLLSRKASPKLAGPLNLPQSAPRFLVNAFWYGLETLADQLVGPPVNRLREKHGLNRIKRIPRWSYSNDLTIGMFPDWYAPPQTDWPKNTQLVGFARFDGHLNPEVPCPTQAFIDAGAPPIAITFGTGMRHAAPMFKNAADACEKLKLRCILLSADSKQLPSELPSSTQHCPFASFERLFPQCAAVIHHGGIGTTAQALAANLPQLIMPLAWDQFDNADRVRRLKAGDSIASNASPEIIAKALAKLTATSNALRPTDYANKIGRQSPFKDAADHIESSAGRHQE